MSELGNEKHPEGGGATEAVEIPSNLLENGGAEFVDDDVEVSATFLNAAKKI